MNQTQRSENGIYVRPVYVVKKTPWYCIAIYGAAFSASVISLLEGFGKEPGGWHLSFCLSCLCLATLIEKWR